MWTDGPESHSATHGRIAADREPGLGLTIVDPMAFRVPAQYRDVFRGLRDMPDEAAEAVVSAMSSAPPFSPTKALVSRADEALSAAEVEATGQMLVAAVMSARSQLALHLETPESLAESIASGADVGTEDTAVRERFRDRLIGLLNADAIRTTTVAADIMVEHERPYQSARTYTDIRPVFADDPSEVPSGAVIVSMLQVSYWTTEGNGEMYFALDPQDLMQLRDVVERALAKTETLRGFLESAGLTYFEVEPE